jgi:N,N'-diacetyllegionaminate synthase
MFHQKKCFIIAEAGVNHNQRLDLALKLVQAAAKAGADAVKFQTFKAEQVVTEKGEMASYQKKNIGKNESQLAMLRKLELKEADYPLIIKECKKAGILFLSTPHGGKASVDLLEHFGMKAYKVGSGDLTNFILLKRIAETKKPVILSSGMATMKEVTDAVDFMKSHGVKEIAMLHCTTNYPCPPSEVNLLAMVTMNKVLSQKGIYVGYSDHTEGTLVAGLSAAFGACVYECHFTLDKNLPGPDHKASCEPEELKERIRIIRSIPDILGSGVKKPAKSELASMIKTVRRSIVAAHDLSEKHVLTEDDIEAKRPGDGLSPKYYAKLIGKKLKKSIKKDGQILLTDVT